MASKRSLFLVLLLSLARADPVKQAKSISLSFGPPATHATFDTAPLNSRRRLFGDNVNDQATVLAFAEWYIEHLLQYPRDSWRVMEDDVRKDAPTGVWRVDARQVAHNGTVEIVDANLSLNILNGEVISYGNSFYHGSPPDFTEAETGTLNPFNGYDDTYPRPLEGPQYNLQSYCLVTTEVASKQWMRENPKWVDWWNEFHKSKKAREKLYEIQDRCQANADKAFQKCIKDHWSSSGPTAWVQKAWVWFQLEVVKNHPSFVQEYLPQECLSEEQYQMPLDLNAPLPFKVPTTYDEDTCRWNFATNHSTTSARLYSLGQSYCEVRPKPDSPCRSFEGGFENLGFQANYDLEELIQNDEGELMQNEGIMDPAIATLKFLASFPHGQPESYQIFVRDCSIVDDGSVRPVKDAYSKIKSRRQPEGGPYAFELQNVPGADGPVNATLVYVQTPPRKTPEVITLEDEDEDDSEKRPISSLTLAWKLSILFKKGRRFDGYAGARYQGALVRLLDLSVRQNPALETSGSKKEGAESCFGWGESAAIQEGAKQFFGRGLASGDNDTTSSSTEGTVVKLPTYRSLNSPLHWGVERMGHAWADILKSVNLTIIAIGDGHTIQDETPAESNPSVHTAESETTSKSTVLTTLVPASLALLPCNPTFLMARDALIQADQILFDGNHTCALRRGFAERGLGVGAHWDAGITWTPWGGGKRKDAFDIPEECGLVGMETMKTDAMKNRRDEL
ncbi:Fungalysin/Thermolysin Extracellular metalloproteinase 5 [Tulasnella sp. 408]|nr:Fungalysin/Thermolysin Extracellular metalloproteinase 5 [Tulasnella sp. 408]